MRAAWTLVRWLRARGWDLQLTNRDDAAGDADDGPALAAERWLCVVGIQVSPATRVEHYSIADTAPLAICRVALDVVER